MKENLIKNEISIELHYNFVDNSTHSIDFHTRNICSLVQVEIISYIIKTLDPNVEFEILSLPPQDGSFKDLNVVKFLNRNTGLITAVTLIFTGLLFNSQREANSTTADFNTLQIVEKCKGLGLDEEKIQKVEDICSSYYTKKQKNAFYQSVISNKDVTSIEPTVIENSKDTFNKEIEKKNFRDYIEEIPKEKEFLKTNLSGNIQLSQPFIDKQQQYGRGVAWKGVYYGSDVFDDNDELIIEDGENIYFYMQDDDYKNQILNQEISFTSGDNIGVTFDISRYYDYINGKFGKPRLYIKRVISHNDNLVQHKQELALKKEKKKFDEKNKNQGLLFHNSQN
ncbi:MAG: hypothetical protein V4665_04435 [Patescibacteria group bacterium]